MNLQWFLMALFGLLVLYFVTGCDIQEWAVEKFCPVVHDCPDCVTTDALFWIGPNGDLHGDVGAAWEYIVDGDSD